MILNIKFKDGQNEKGAGFIPRLPVTKIMTLQSCLAKPNHGQAILSMAVALNSVGASRNGHNASHLESRGPWVKGLITKEVSRRE